MTRPDTHMGDAKWYMAPSECLAWVALGLVSEGGGSGYCPLGSPRKCRTFSRKLPGPQENTSWQGQDQGLVPPCRLTCSHRVETIVKGAWGIRG